MPCSPIPGYEHDFATDTNQKAHKTAPSNRGRKANRLSSHHHQNGYEAYDKYGLFLKQNKGRTALTKV